MQNCPSRTKPTRAALWSHHIAAEGRADMGQERRRPSTLEELNGTIRVIFDAPNYRSGAHSVAKWQFTKGLHDLGDGCLAYLQPDGGWGWSNAGLVVDGEENLLIDTLFDFKFTQEMLDTMRNKVPSAQKIKKLVNT